MEDHYKQLGLDPGATPIEIVQVMDRLRSELSKYAPGVDFSDDDVARLLPEKWSSFQVLSDPSQKESYDLALHAVKEDSPLPEASTGALPPQSRMSAFFSYLAFIGLMSVAILFLLLLAGYML